VFTPLAVGLLFSACVTAQSVPQTILDAGYVVVLKKELRLELLRQAKVIKTYEVALRPRRAQRPDRETTRRRKASTFWISEKLTDSSTGQSTSRLSTEGRFTLRKSCYVWQNLFPTHRPGGTALNASRTVLDNAIYALVLIHQGNGLAVVQKLHSESGIAVDPDAGKRLQSAAKDATKKCDERWREKCVDALAN
jgi:hypothetical protein